MKNISVDKNISGDSTKWKNWISVFAPNTCKLCAEKHGAVYPAYLTAIPDFPAHPNGLCYIDYMRTKQVGTASKAGLNGVDAHLMYGRGLLSYYIRKGDARSKGWVQAAGNLANVLPGRMIGGDIYGNREGKLPSANNRIWYEADIDYKSGYRNDSRILYSNDGLIFVTYDHYHTFYEITR